MHFAALAFDASSKTPSIFEQALNGEGMESVLDDFKWLKQNYEPLEELSYLHSRNELTVSFKRCVDEMVARGTEPVALIRRLTPAVPRRAHGRPRKRCSST